MAPLTLWKITCVTRRRFPQVHVRAGCHVQTAACCPIGAPGPTATWWERKNLSPPSVTLLQFLFTQRLTRGWLPIRHQCLLLKRGGQNFWKLYRSKISIFLLISHIALHCLFVHLSVCLCVFVSVSIHLSIHSSLPVPNTFTFHLPVFSCLFLHPSLHLTHLFTCLSAFSYELE